MAKGEDEAQLSIHHQDHAFPWSKGLLFVKESMNFKRRRDSKMVYNEL